MLSEPSALNGADGYNLLDTPPERGFDDIVHLARQLRDVPVALVALLDRDRQWFKARVGFPLCETALDRSVRRFVVAEDTLIEIPDLATDPRTRDNPLVTGDPFLRFYAGTPLRTRLGTIGALCVIDNEPRPAGLTVAQTRLLEMLARQVVDLVEPRQQSADLRAAERRWRDLFETMDEGFVLASVVRDPSGCIQDWRYEEVNPAWGRLIGVEPERVTGRTVREIIPGIESAWIDDLARVVETGASVRFTRQIGPLGRWSDGTAQPVSTERFTVTFREVTDRIAAEHRREGLVLLGDLLRDERDMSVLKRRAAEIVGRAMGAARACYGGLDHGIETVSIADGWEEPGMPSVVGRYRFDDYGRLRDTLLAGEPVVITDVTTDPRTADDAALWLRLRARSVVNLPVREDGRTVALLLVHHHHPHDWTTDELVWLHNAADRIEVAVARRQAEERQALANVEIVHRLKNTLAMVQAIANMTLRKVLSPDELARFGARLQALGRAHDLLHTGRWRASDLGELLAGALDGAGVLDRCRLDGPTLQLGASAAMSTALLVHELATNAGKYGALSVPAGTVDANWRIVDTGSGRQLVLDWVERHGPPTRPPSRIGFGSRLISLGLAGTGGADVRYDDAGFSATFRADVKKIGQD